MLFATFNKLITVSPDFFEYFKSNLYTLSEYNRLLRNPVRNIKNSLYISKASIPGSSSETRTRKEMQKYCKNLLGTTT